MKHLQNKGNRGIAIFIVAVALPRPNQAKNKLAM
jgi:hypothetical protein